MENNKFVHTFPIAKWTIFFLFNGENDLMREVEMAYDQLANVGSSYAEVNLVVLFDGLSYNQQLGVLHRDLDVADRAYPLLYYVTKSRKLTTSAQPVGSYPKLDNLAEKNVLGAIIDEAKMIFPAEHYGFVYKGHGGAGRTDITSEIFRVDKVRCFNNEDSAQLKKRLQKRVNSIWSLGSVFELYDDPEVLSVIYTYNEKDPAHAYREMTYPRLRDELVAGGFGINKKLDFLCLDCCWGQNIENALIFKDVASYFIASADEMPVLGIGYQEFAEFLTLNPDIRPDELAANIVGIFFKNNYNNYTNSPKWIDLGVSFTAVDLAKCAGVVSRLEALVDFILPSKGKPNDALFKVIGTARSACREYTNNLNPAVYGLYTIDLLWFLENLIHFNSGADPVLKGLAEDLQSAISATFITNHMASNYAVRQTGETNIGGRGLAITFPTNSDTLKWSLYGDHITEDSSEDEKELAGEVLKGIVPLRIEKWGNFLNWFVSQMGRPENESNRELMKIAQSKWTEIDLDDSSVDDSNTDPLLQSTKKQTGPSAVIGNGAPVPKKSSADKKSPIPKKSPAGKKSGSGLKVTPFT